MDQPPAVALTAFADAWPRATETEIGAALCAIRRGKDFDFDVIMLFRRFLYLPSGPRNNAIEVKYAILLKSPTTAR